MAFGLNGEHIAETLPLSNATEMSTLQPKSSFEVVVRVTHIDGPVEVKTQYGLTQRSMITFMGDGGLHLIGVAYGALALKAIEALPINAVSFQSYLACINFRSYSMSRLLQSYQKSNRIPSVPQRIILNWRLVGLGSKVPRWFNFCIDYYYADVVDEMNKIDLKNEYYFDKKFPRSSTFAQSGNCIFFHINFRRGRERDFLRQKIFSRVS